MNKTNMAILSDRDSMNNHPNSLLSMSFPLPAAELADHEDHETKMDCSPASAALKRLLVDNRVCKRRKIADSTSCPTKTSSSSKAPAEHEAGLYTMTDMLPVLPDLSMDDNSGEEEVVGGECSFPNLFSHGLISDDDEDDETRLHTSCPDLFYNSCTTATRPQMQTVHQSHRHRCPRGLVRSWTIRSPDQYYSYNTSSNGCCSTKDHHHPKDLLEGSLSSMCQEYHNLETISEVIHGALSEASSFS